MQRSEREELERALEDRSAQTLSRIEALTRSFEDMVRSSEISPPDDEHDPDGATSGFERAQVAALLEAARAELAELEEARTRLASGSFGLCESCGNEIGVQRLVARPSVRTCVRCARRRRNPRST
jgi:DnaK suppressor protein